MKSGKIFDKKAVTLQLWKHRVYTTIARLFTAVSSRMSRFSLYDSIQKTVWRFACADTIKH